MYFFVLPKAVSLATLQISRSVDMALGTKVMSSLPWKTKTPPEKARRIFELSQTFLDTLGARRGLRFRLHWMADTTFANAFALPGGDVLLFPRILDPMDSSSELLAVLAHEAGHEVQRHGMQNMLRAGLLGIVSSLSLGDVSGIGAVLADNAGSLLALSYNRREEAEADAFAIKALAELGQDCHGMELFFGKKPTEKSNYLPKFLSTHPSDSDRVKAVQKMRLKNSGCAISSQAWISSEAWARFKVKDSFENPAKDK